MTHPVIPQPRRGRTWRVLAVTAMVATLYGTYRGVISSRHVGDAVQPSRAELVSLAVTPAPGRIATIVLDPAQCMTCDPGIQSMLYTYRLHPELFELRLTRAPTRREQHELTVRGFWHNVVIDTTAADIVAAGHPVVVYRYTDASVHRMPIEAAVALAWGIRPKHE